jgi:hypothetical protein
MRNQVPHQGLCKIGVDFHNYGNYYYSNDYCHLRQTVDSTRGN